MTSVGGNLLLNKKLFQNFCVAGFVPIAAGPIIGKVALGSNPLRPFCRFVFFLFV